MGQKNSKRSVAKGSKVTDLPARTDRGGAVRGGIIVNWAAADGSVRPGQDKGVIAIIRPAEGGR